MGDLHVTSHPLRPHCTYVFPIFLPTLPPHPCLWCAPASPSKPSSTRVTSLFFSSAQERRRRVCGPHNSSCHQSTWSRSRLYSLTTPHCISSFIFSHFCGRRCLRDRTFFWSFCLCLGQPPKKVGLHVSLPCYHMPCLAPILTIPSALCTILFAYPNPLSCLLCT